ncbi:MAG: arcB [Chitinophagaceae bacterium]|nr:arcB [Chitinophagaceae bacterium]
MSCFYRYILLVFFAFGLMNARASDVLILNDDRQEYIIAGKTVDVFKDSTQKMTFEQIVLQYQKIPSSFSIKGEQVSDPRAAYWMRFKIKDLSSGKYNWILELYDNRLDDVVLYLPMKDGSYKIIEAGDRLKFKDKDFQHINFVFSLNGIPSLENVVYMRLHSKHEIYIYGLVRSVERFVAYTTHEYFWVAIFYGVLLALAVYNLLMLLSVRDRDNSYIYYILYVLSTAFYSLSRDGMGFQFLWPNCPVVNTFAEPLGLYCIAITLLLYAREFLNTKNNNPWLDKLIRVTVVMRTLIFIVGLMVSSQFTRNIYMDFPLMLLAYIAGFVSYRGGYKASRYYIIGFTFLLVGFGIIVLKALGVALNDVIAFYSFNMGVVIQFVVLSIALGDRVRFIIRQKNEVQEKLIEQLKTQEAFKDLINLQLEAKVRERTLELEEKNSQLDSFVYKASHDIKGPLRSLMGLTKVGMVDFEKVPEASVYFQHIMKTATKLDVILEDLLTFTKLKTSQLQKNKIDVESMMRDILDTFHHLNGFDNLKISMAIEGDDQFVTDEKVLYSILQNLTENAIKYQDERKEISWLKITIISTAKETSIVFEDNGAGISESHLVKIFDMFYKVNDKSIGSGLGLYILKQAVQKLSGTVDVQSIRGEGSTFTIKLPNEAL